LYPCKGTAFGGSLDLKSRLKLVKNGQIACNSHSFVLYSDSN
jgi:hypothetical protein